MFVCVCACLCIAVCVWGGGGGRGGRGGGVVPWWCSGKHGVLPFHRLVVQIPPGVKWCMPFFTHFVL